MAAPKFIRVAGELYRLKIDRTLRVGSVNFHYAAEVAKPQAVDGSLAELLKAANLNASSDEAKQSAGRMLALVWTIGEYINTKSAEELGKIFLLEDAESLDLLPNSILGKLYSEFSALKKDPLLNKLGQIQVIDEALAAFNGAIQSAVKKQLGEIPMKQPDPIHASSNLPKFIRVEGQLYQLREAAELSPIVGGKLGKLISILEGIMGKGIRKVNDYLESKNVIPDLKQLPKLMKTDPTMAMQTWEDIGEVVLELVSALGQSPLGKSLGQVTMAFDGDFRQQMQDLASGPAVGDEVSMTSLKNEPPGGVDWGAHAPQKDLQPGQELSLKTESGGVPTAKNVDWGKFAQLLNSNEAFRTQVQAAIQDTPENDLQDTVERLFVQFAEQPQFIRIQGRLYKLDA